MGFNRGSSWSKQFKRTANEERTSADGILHPSAAQLKRWNVLLLLQSQGIIRNLQREVDFPLTIDDKRAVKTKSGKRIRCYRADHVYERESIHGNGDWKRIIEDVKGWLTPEAELKIRVFEAIYQVNVLIVR